MRFGFILADLFAGSSLSMWPAVAAMFPDDGEHSLVVFPGGRLGNGGPHEASQNFIYDFAGPANLDASIIWSSSLTGDADSDQVMQRFGSLTDLPMVTISGKTTAFPGIPDVSFDAGEGTAFLVRHCIEVHKASRFAYIRGPEHHKSANQRFLAFLDALREYGIEPDMNLVSDPVPWERGDLGMKQLVQERSLVPGKDFDVLFCASDLILYHASKVLTDGGWDFPENLIVCGFNDSMESRLLRTPVTTVRFPDVELGRHSVKMLMDLIQGKEVSDVLLPAFPVIRRSCGCSGDYRRSFASVAELTDFISDSFLLQWRDADSLVGKLVRNPSEKSLMDTLCTLCATHTNLLDIYTVIHGISQLFDFRFLNETSVEDYVNRNLPEIIDRDMYQISYGERLRYSNFSKFSKDLIVADSFDEISQLLAEYAPQFGFSEIRLHVFPRDAEKGERDILEKTGNGVWIASPLCSDSEEMGYLLMKPLEFNGLICEEIRSSVSAAVKSVLLLEDARRARQVAEEAEQARITFFANVGENLRDPLSEIYGLVSDSGMDSHAKKAVIDRLTGAKRTLDLVLSSIGEVELNRHIVNPAQILRSFSGFEESGPLACLLIDEERINEAVSILVSGMKKARISARMQRRGVRMDFIDEKGKWDPSVLSSTDGELVRKIILMHGGTTSFADNVYTITLPYPTLGGHNAPPLESGAVIACMGGDPGITVDDCVTESVDGVRFASVKRLLPGVGAVCWNPAFKGYNGLTALLALLSNGQYRNLPFICTECPRSRTLEDSMRTAVEPGGKIILQVGKPASDFHGWIADTEVVSTSLANAHAEILARDPGLVMVFLPDAGNLDAEAFRRLGMMGRIPVIVCSDYIDSNLVARLGELSNVLAVNNCILESEEFIMRVRAILGGASILPAATGIIVKRAQVCLCRHATAAVSRWQIAEEVHVSEDYLTRIFKKELGLSPWDYLNRFRVWLACRLLVTTGRSINEIALATGFQDQAYFCRVFKKVKGMSPGRMRSLRRN